VVVVQAVMERQTLVAVAAVAVVVTVAQVLLSYVMLVRKKVQAAQLHLLAGLQFIHLQHLAHLRLKEKYVTFC
jgi:hypothetical protein